MKQDEIKIGLVHFKNGFTAEGGESHHVLQHVKKQDHVTRRTNQRQEMTNCITFHKRDHKWERTERVGAVDQSVVAGLSDAVLEYLVEVIVLIRSSGFSQVKLDSC